MPPDPVTRLCSFPRAETISVILSAIRTGQDAHALWIWL
jgi:hypothetical protein